MVTPTVTVTEEYLSTVLKLTNVITQMRDAQKEYFSTGNTDTLARFEKEKEADKLNRTVNLLTGEFIFPSQQRF